MPDHRIRPASLADVEEMIRLARHHSDEVGFLPRRAVEEYVGLGRAAVASMSDGTPAGYVIYRPRPAYDRRCVTIVQACVPDDLMRLGVGSSLLRHAEVTSGCEIGQAFVASDIDARHFWRALGYRVVGERPGGNARRRSHVIWRRAIAEAADIAVIDPRHMTRPNTPRPTAEVQVALWDPPANPWATGR